MFEREQQFTIRGHDTEFGHRRNFEMFVQGPENGVNEETGVLVLVQNLDSYANTKFWHELRSRWADRYNVLAVGLNYMGSAWKNRAISNDFLLLPTTVYNLYQLLEPEQRDDALLNDPDRLLSLFAGQDLTDREITFDQAHDLNFWKNYPDYGFIQAMDCIWALGAVWQVCDSESIPVNKRRNYIMGINEGGHIAHMCGRFAPHTFALILDNSGYPGISVDTMLGFKADYVKRTLPVAGGQIEALVKLPSTYGLTDDSTYYVTEDMIQIRNPKSYIVPGSGKYILIQSEGGDYERYQLQRTMREQGIDIDYIVVEDVLTEQNLVDITETSMDRYLKPDSKEMLVLEGPTDFEMGTRISFETVNGNYTVDYASGRPQVSFEGEVVVLRQQEEETPEEITITASPEVSQVN